MVGPLLKTETESVPGGPLLSHQLEINGTRHEVTAPADTPLLWILRDELGLTGTRYGCGAGYCGACMVHVDGNPAPACQLRVGALADGP